MSTSSARGQVRGRRDGVVPIVSEDGGISRYGGGAGSGDETSGSSGRQIAQLVVRWWYIW